MRDVAWRRSAVTCIPERRGLWVLSLAVLLFLGGARAASARILIPMDLTQTDHLKAYGIAYWVLTRGETVEWLLNYRGGSFLIEDDDQVLRETRLRGVLAETIDEGAVNAIHAELDNNNMDAILLEKAPRVAIYIPPGYVPWDDAVTLAFTYAQIPYTAIWDEEVLRGELANYDWLHLHHEDFTGQYGKFYGSFRNADWYRDQVAREEAKAKRLGFAKVSEEKHAVAGNVRGGVA